MWRCKNGQITSMAQNKWDYGGRISSCGGVKTVKLPQWHRTNGIMVLQGNEL